MADEEKKTDDGPNRIMVYLRIRPAKKGEINPAEGSTYLMDVQPDQKTCALEGGKQYTFDWIFNGDNVKQEDIYSKVMINVIDNVFKGFWGTCMVYGQTGTGKSFTMCNFSPTNQGIIPRTMQYIFELIQRDQDRQYTVLFSFIQIYLDKLQDLFNPEAPELKINRDKDGVSFPGVKEHVVNSQEHFEELYEDGHQHRVIRETKMNPESSRGHAALFIQIKSVPKDDPSGEVRNGKLFLIDLAGYERFSKTGVQEGLMKEEAKTINASLLSLGNVVQALSEKSEHVPWRNAKLTRMLEDAIGGKAKCSIILTAGPSSEHMHETLGTLYFGSRAMAVKTNAKLAVNIDYQKLAKKLQEMLSAAESKINVLEVEATRRQLEREETEARFQQETARIKQRQEEQLQALLTQGASPEKIQELIAANKAEQDLLEEQHYIERTALDERHETDIQEELRAQQAAMLTQSETKTAGMSSNISKLQKEVASLRDENDRLKTKAKEAEGEARRLLVEVNELKMKGEEAGLGDFSAVAGGGASKAELRKEFERRVEVVKQMMEENYALKLAEVEEPLQEEVTRYKRLYTELRDSHDEQLQLQKDALTSAYEAEIAEIRRTSHEVQEKLKRNHMTIKKSYQSQREVLSEENTRLLQQIADLTRALESGGGSVAAAATASPMSPDKRVGVPSLAEVMIQKKQAEKRCDELAQQIADLRSEIAYAQAEKEGYEKQLNEYVPREGEERMNPAAVRQMKQEHETLKKAAEKMEQELFKLKAAQALSGPQEVAADDSDDDNDRQHEDIHGDIEGVNSFVQKMLRFPYFVGAQPIQNSHDTILKSLTADLDEYRRMTRFKFFMIGDSNTGKSTFLKCLTAASVPLIRNVPEVVSPTIHPVIQTGFVEDQFVSKTDWYKLYVEFKDIAESAQGQPQSGGLFGGIASGFGSLLGGGQKGVADPAKIHVDVIDTPGSRQFWRAIPPHLLPAKNAIYCITYDMSHPVDITKTNLERQLALIHASCARNYPRSIGGDGPRVGVCLIGTKKDTMRDSRESTVVGHLNKVTLSLGDVFYKLRGEDTFGIICVGNFAISCADWSVTSTKGARGPQSFKDLFAYLGAVATQIYSNKPSAFLPASKESASHMTYMLGEEMMEGNSERTSTLDAAQQRLRKGIVTFMTGLAREAKVRWVMEERELRRLCCEHLALDGASSIGINACNFIIRELLVRGSIVALPSSMMEPKYLPKAELDMPPDEKPLPRDGIVCLDPNRILLLYSLFMAPSTCRAISEGSALLKDKQAILFDHDALRAASPAWQQGILTQDAAQVVLARVLPLAGNDVKLMLEFYSIMGLSLNLRTEVAVVSPAHFSTPMPLFLTEYVPYLVSNFGDGVGRKYKLNCLPASFFARLQTKLVPFSHAPCKDPQFTQFNWTDASYLVLEKSRLKWAIMGSKVVKDAVIAAKLPLRGLMKAEGECLYIAITARGDNPSAMIDACKKVMEAIHYEITSLCKREFRGIRAQSQDMIIGGCESKRLKLPIGIRTIMSKVDSTDEEINTQLQIIGNMSDPKCGEIEAAITALPAELKEE